MKLVIQRVKKASVSIDNEIYSEISHGILVLIGVEKGDKEENARWLVDKIVNLRIFEDEDGKMNRSAIDVGGEFLVVSQFTLSGCCRKGTRPSFDKAEAPSAANDLYEYFVKKLQEHNVNVKTGVFGAMMDVSLVNDGPVTLIIEKM